MGQQQLLLLVLVVVLVGVASVMGILLMQESWAKSHRDALTTYAYSITADVLAWKQKPAQMGGGRGRRGYQGFALTAIGCERAFDCYATGTNPNAPGRNGVSIVHLYTKPRNRQEILIRGNPQETEAVGIWFHGPTLACVSMRHLTNGQWDLSWDEYTAVPADCETPASDSRF